MQSLNKIPVKGKKKSEILGMIPCLGYQSHSYFTSRSRGVTKKGEKCSFFFISTMWRTYVSRSGYRKSEIMPSLDKIPM